MAVNNNIPDPSRFDKLYLLKTLENDWHDGIPITVDEFSKLSIPRASELLKHESNAPVVLNERKPWKIFFIPFLVPCRTDSIGSFVRDLTLPAFFNIALAVNNLKAKIFLSCLAAPVDLITLPLRLTTAIPRIFWNLSKRKEQHPVYKFLRDNGCDKKYLDENNCYKLMFCQIKRDFDPSLNRSINKIEGHIIKFGVAPAPFFLNHTMINRIKGNVSDAQLQKCYLHNFRHLKDDDFKRDLREKDEISSLKIKKSLFKPSCIEFINLLARYIPNSIDPQAAQSKNDEQLLAYCKQGWKKFAAKFHPDKSPADGGEAFKTVSQKYSHIMNCC